MSIIYSPEKHSLRSTINLVPWKEVARLFALALFVTIMWCITYNRTTMASWNVPVSYYWDAWWNMATIKAYQEGDLSPFSWMTVRALNAPFSANWNDFPTSEKMLPYFIGITARLFGLIPALNLAALMASVLAALGFYIACRLLRYQWMFAFAIAAIFAFSHYISARLPIHLNLAYCFHVPLYLLVTWWCLDSRELPFTSTRWWFASAIGALTGFLAIYYAFLFWQFLGFAIIAHLLRHNTSKVKSVLSIAVISVACTMAMAIPHQLYRILHGPNTAVVQRSLAGLEVFGLKLPELFLPPIHRWKAFSEFARANYYEPATIRGEMGSPYLGVVGIMGLVWLIGLGVTRLLKGNVRLIPVMFWQTLWITVFALIGGVNLLLGVAGLQLFRATNRYSILLLCLALLFLTKMLGRICPPAYRSVAVLGLLLVGLWDELPPIVDDQGLKTIENIVTEDRTYIQRLEQKVPSGTMVFQLPVMEFPEVPPQLRVVDYSHFRPYLHSSKLRYSYGSNKGRALEGWQRDMEILPAKEMAEKLEGLGFGVILIDRAGFSDSAAGLLRDLESCGRKVIEQKEGATYVAIGLRASDRPVLPEIPPFPGTGFYGWEGDWRKSAHTWSKGNAILILTNIETKPVDKQYTLSLGSLSNRQLTIITPKETRTIALTPGQPKTVALLPLQLAPGETTIQFVTDTPAISPGPADQRKLAFSVALVAERPQGPVPVLGPGFYGWEGDWRKGAHSWSEGTATLVITNPETTVIEKRYSFTLSSLSKRQVTITTPSETRTVGLVPGKFVTIGPFTLRLQPGRNPIRFETDRPPVPAGPGDPRRMTFSMAITGQTE